MQPHEDHWQKTIELNMHGKKAVLVTARGNVPFLHPLSDEAALALAQRGKFIGTLARARADAPAWALQPKKPKKRALDQFHTLVRGTDGKIRVVQPNRQQKERRRIKPAFGKRLSMPGSSVTATAKELFVNLGPQNRGLGTRKQTRRRRGH